MCMQPDSAQEWIERLELRRHPEGGYFTETYRSNSTVSSEPPSEGRRCLATAIYYLLESGDMSAFHRLRSDEIWHSYAGNTLTLYLIAPDGSGGAVRLGRCAGEGEVPQAVVSAGTWIAARVEAPNTYALCGCTVSPGFEFEDFELARRDDLLRQHPIHREWILSLTRETGS